ncbi:MAG: hypothetical protein LC746_04515 [Acidobacteria bacterium]|nr:hypothetical protein [Acidobacteriota bacterium]
MDEHAGGEIGSPPQEIASPPHEVPSIWGGAQALAPSVARVIVSTQAGNGLALIFPPLTVELNTNTQTLLTSSVASFTAPLETDEGKPFLGYLVTVEGQIFKTAGTRAALLIDAAGQTKTLEFPFGEERAASSPSNDTGFVRLEYFGVERRGARSQYADGRRPPLPPFHATLTLTAQRTDAQEVVRLDVDSMSVEAFEV